MLRFWIYRHQRLLILLSIAILGIATVWSIEQFNHDPSFFLIDNHRPTTDLKKLEKFLKAKQWEAADRETTRLILAATDTSTDLLGNLEPRLVKRLPCADLQAIDQLWVKYSGGRFGFSVQKRIFEAIAETPASKKSDKKLEALAPHHNKQLSPAKSPHGLTEASTSDGNSQKIWHMNQFSNRIGYGLQKAAKPTIQAPAGRLPSWGVFFEQPASNFKPFSTPEFVQRQKWCRLP